MYDALECACENDRLKLLSGSYTEDIAICKQVEIYSRGLVFVNKVTVLESCTLKGLHLGHVDVVQGRHVYLIDCLVDTLSANCALVAEGCNFASVGLNQATQSKFRQCTFGPALQIF